MKAHSIYVHVHKLTFWLFSKRGKLGGLIISLSEVVWGNFSKKIMWTKAVGWVQGTALELRAVSLIYRYYLKVRKLTPQDRDPFIFSSARTQHSNWRCSLSIYGSTFVALVIIFYTYCIYPPFILIDGKAHFIAGWTEGELSSILITLAPISLRVWWRETAVWGGGKCQKTNESLLDGNVRSLVLPFTPSLNLFFHLNLKDMIKYLSVRLPVSPSTFSCVAPLLTSLPPFSHTSSHPSSSLFRFRLPLVSLVV